MITLDLSDEIQQALTTLARQTGRSEADLAQEAITLYLQREERVPLHSLGSGANDQVRARDIEEWLEMNYRPA